MRESEQPKPKPPELLEDLDTFEHEWGLKCKISYSPEEDEENEGQQQNCRHQQKDPWRRAKKESQTPDITSSAQHLGFESKRKARTPCASCEPKESSKKEDLKVDFRKVRLFRCILKHNRICCSSGQ
jgi:hypothetical protein